MAEFIITVLLMMSVGVQLQGTCQQITIKKGDNEILGVGGQVI